MNRCATTDLLAVNLSGSDPKEILYALSLFEVEQQRAAHPAIRALLGHSAPEVRQKAVAILSAAGDRAAVPEVQRLLRDPELSVRTEALLFLSHHAHVDPLTAIEQLGDFPDFSVRSAIVAFWRSPARLRTWTPPEIFWTPWSTKQDTKACFTGWKRPNCWAGCQIVSILCSPGFLPIRTLT